MTDRMPPDWVHVVRENRAGPGRLHIWHRRDQPVWVDDAVAYWAGRLDGLSEVLSSRFAVVHRGRECYFKRYVVRGWRDFFKHLVRPSRARRALRGGGALERAGFHAPRPACLVEERVGGAVRASALVTEEVSHAPDLRAWLNRPVLGVATDLRRKRALLRAFAREVGRLHAAGFHHADMRIGNVLCRMKGSDWEFYWLDNEGIRRWRRLPRRLQIHNLMQVNMERAGVTLADRMRFWQEYKAAAGVSPMWSEDTLQAVIRWTRERWRERGWLARGRDLA